MRWATTAAVIVLATVIAGCGSGSDDVRASQHAETDAAWPFPAVGAVRSGAVVYGGRRAAGSGIQLGSTGEVIDPSGRTTLHFETDVPFDRATFVELDDRIVLVGVPCRQVVGRDDASGDLKCSPGGVGVRSIDRASGEVSTVDLPEPSLADVPVTRGPVEGFPAGDSVVLRTPSEAGDGERLWVLREGRGWKPLEPPAGRVCATGEHLIAHRVDVPQGTVDPTTDVEARAEVWVYDAEASTWSPPTISPPAATATGTSFGSVACTLTRVAFFPATTRASHAVVFEPATRTWDELPLDAGASTEVYSGWSNTDLVTTPGRPGVVPVIDVGDGHRSEIDSGLAADGTDVIDMVALGRGSFLVVDLEDGDRRVLRGA